MIGRVIFWLCFPQARPKELLRIEDNLLTIRDDTRNMLNMQHITPNSGSWGYSDIPLVAIGKIKGPVHMVEGGHPLN